MAKKFLYWAICPVAAILGVVLGLGLGEVLNFVVFIMILPVLIGTLGIMMVIYVGLCWWGEYLSQRVKPAQSDEQTEPVLQEGV